MRLDETNHVLQNSQPSLLYAETICVPCMILFRWHAVASWTWDAQDETCGICRMAFDGCCPDCKLPGDDCPLSKQLTSVATMTLLNQY